jgi:hypothetical protein
VDTVALTTAVGPIAAEPITPYPISAADPTLERVTVVR